MKRIRPTLFISAGFFVGLFLARIDHILPVAHSTGHIVQIVARIVDWTAPPLAGALLAAAVLVPTFRFTFVGGGSLGNGAFRFRDLVAERD